MLVVSDWVVVDVLEGAVAVGVVVLGVPVVCIWVVVDVLEGADAVGVVEVAMLVGD